MVLGIHYKIVKYTILLNPLDVDVQTQLIKSWTFAFPRTNFNHNGTPEAFPVKHLMIFWDKSTLDYMYIHKYIVLHSSPSHLQEIM
jgi:hypothetical protein